MSHFKHTKGQLRTRSLLKPAASDIQTSDTFTWVQEVLPFKIGLFQVEHWLPASTHTPVEIARITGIHCLIRHTHITPNRIHFNEHLTTICSYCWLSCSFYQMCTFFVSKTGSVKLKDLWVESGVSLTKGLYVLCDQWTKFRDATGQTYQSLFILQRPLVGPVPCHGSAVWTRPATWWNVLAWKWEETDSDISLCKQWLKHWADFSLCVGVHKGNSSWRMRPGYSKFLHFIVSSPQLDTHCEAGLQRLEVGSTLPSGSTANQTRINDAHWTVWTCQ